MSGTIRKSRSGGLNVYVSQGVGTDMAVEIADIGFSFIVDEDPKIRYSRGARCGVGGGAKAAWLCVG
jgi:hypothetical protein